MRGRGNPSTRRGSALIVSLIAIVTLAALGAAFLRVTTALTSRQTDDVENMKAFYLAEAGLAEGFQAVRMGRTGQVGSEAAPARHGDGILWVDATATAADQVRLESTALVGRGRASLAYVVEPVEVPLGFFGDEELVVESVLLVDGYDSTEETYAEAAGGELKAYADWLVGVIGPDFFYKAVNSANQTSLAPADSDAAGMTSSDLASALATEFGMSVSQEEELRRWLPELAAGYPNGYDPAGPITSGTPTDPVAADGDLGLHTEGGGLLGSNGNVLFQVAGGEPVEVYGDVTPGPDGAIVGLETVAVTGITEPRPQLVELPAVEVPAVALDPALRHEGLLPLLVPAGAVGYERLEVAADAELILQGPSTVVIGTLVLEPGATLSLDTRDGDVALFITVEMDLQPGSLVWTSEDPKETTILVPEIPTGLGGAPIRLDATAQFHGTIYAPLTDVRIGSEFEIYGGVIAKRLEIGAGARLHFDNAGFEDSPIPRIVSWRIIEIPSAVRGTRDPFERLGLTADDLEPIASSHDLASVQMVVTYLDHGGTLRSWEGSEDLFDWDLVAEVIEVDRDPDRKLDPDADEPPPDTTDDPLTETEQALLAAMQAGTLTSSEINAKLQYLAPVPDALLAEALLVQPAMDEWDLYYALLANGPAGPGYPGGKGTLPIGDSVLLKAVQDSPMGSQSLSWVLEQNSPLSPEVMAAVYARTPALKPGDLNRVESVQ